MIWVVTIIISNWVLLTKPMFYTHDYLHGARIAEFQRGLLEGQMPVIWSQNFGFGFGMPLFQFYAPLPYAVGALFYLLGFNLLIAVKMIIALSNIATLVGGYIWAREFYNKEISALAGAFLTLASYRAIDIFARGAISEIWAIMALPWLLAGITKIMHGKIKTGFWLSVAGGTILALSHNITTLLAVPFVILYVLFLIIKWDKIKKSEAKLRIKNLLLAGMAVFGLTAFYLLPAFFEKNYTQVETFILGDYFNFRLHFLYFRQFFLDNFGYGGSGYGPDDGLSFFLGWAQLLGWMITGLVISYQLISNKGKVKKEESKKIKWIAGIMLLTVAAMWMSTFKSQWWWEKLSSLLEFVQFPWRLLSLTIVFLSLVSVAGLSWLKEKWQNRLIGLLLLILAISSFNYFQGEKYLTEPAFYQSDENYIRESMSPILVDYLPSDFVFYDGLQAIAKDIKVLKTDKQPNIKVDKMDEKLYIFQNDQEIQVELTVANYPGWVAEINGKKTNIETSKLGNMLIELPAGEVALGLKLKSTPWRWWSNMISLITLLLLIRYGWYKNAK